MSLREEIIAALAEAADPMRPSIGHPEFFLRKGIGWALREYAKTDPAWVRAFVEAHPGLSALSRREALRNLERSGGAPPFRVV